MIIYQNNDICLRSLESEDAILLVKWLADPVVLEYYEGRDRPHNMEMVRKHFYEDRDEVTGCIIQYNQTDIGYLQFYLIDEEELELYDLKEYPGTIYGMDQFIGESEYWNQGIGSRLIHATVNFLIDNKGADKIVMDPQAWNARALRVYEKCGFSKRMYLEKHEMHEGQLRDCWLIEYDATTSPRKEGVPLKLQGYMGQYVKIITKKQDWFICEPIQLEENGIQKESETMINILLTNRNSDYNKGVMSLKHEEVDRIEELEPEVIQGIRLTLTNVPDILEAYKSLNTVELPSRIKFGKRRETD